MKKHLLIVFIVLYCIVLNAQTIKLQLNNYKIKLPEGEVTFVIDTSCIAIKFAENVSLSEKIKYFTSQHIFKEYDSTWTSPFEKIVIAKFDNERDKVLWQNKLVKLEESQLVAYIAPVLLYNNIQQQTLYDMFFVKLKKPDDLQLLKNLAVSLRFEISEEHEKGIFYCRASKNSKGNSFEIAKYLQELDYFEFAEPDFIYTNKLETNDTFFSSQWALNNTGQFGGSSGADMDLVNAWTITTGSPSIKVAILDCFGSSNQFTHPDITFFSTYDATGTGFTSNGLPGEAHGINCAGIVGATGNNSLGVVGVAYGSKVVAVKLGTIISGTSWQATGNTISNGITWAYQNTDVISNSNSFGSSSSLIDNAISNSITLGRGGLGTPFFSSTGNINSNAIVYPASNSNTIAVTATSMCDERKSYSSCDGENWGANYGTGTDVAAPGVHIYTTDIAGSAGYANGDYIEYYNGTSAACPMAAGVMALILSVNPNLTHNNARALLESTCEKVGGYTYYSNIFGQSNGTWSTNLGYGRVNAYQAVLGASCNSNPPNDNCNDALTLNDNTTCTYTSGTVDCATNDGFPTLPTCNGNSTTQLGVFYKFIAQANNATIKVKPTTTSSMGLDAIIVLYSGTDCYNLNEVSSGCMDNYAAGVSETLTVYGLVPNQTYWIRVYDYGAVLPPIGNGGFQICVTHSAGCSSPNILSSPSNHAVTAPSGTSFSVSASGGVTPYSYQWQYNFGSGWQNVPNNSPYSGITSSTLNINSTTIGMSSYQYRCVVTSGSPCTTNYSTSNSASLSVNTGCTAPSILNDPLDLSVTAPSGVSFNVNATGGFIPYLYQWQYDYGIGWVNVPNNSQYSGVTSSTLNVNSTTIGMDNYHYRCIVYSGNACTSFNVISNSASLSVNTNCTAPGIWSNPYSHTVIAPNSTSFYVSASGGVSPYSYQWEYNAGSGWFNVSNNATYSDVTSHTLNISNTTTSMNGYLFRCKVYSGNTCNLYYATSSHAALFINLICSTPTINTQPVSQNVTVSNGANFSIAATGGQIPYTYQWQYNSGSGWLNVPNTTPYSGVTSSTLNINSSTISMSNYQYRCIVSSSDPCSSYNVNSNPATLTVNPAGTNIIMSNSGTYTVCSANFYDGGGFAGNYPNNQNTVVTIYPLTPGAKVSVTFNSFKTQVHYNDQSNFSQINDDILFVFNGNSVASPQIGALQGQSGYGTITSTATDGSLTFKFVSYTPFYTPPSGARAGWEAIVSCNYTPTDITMIASGSFTTCGGNFYDSGGPNGNYMDNQNAIMPSGGTVVTLYPAIAGTKLSVTFNSFRTQTHYNDLTNFSIENNDILYVYNGNSIASTQIGALQGQAGYGTITSTAPDGSLTFKFVSRSPFYTPPAGSRSGWDATISCNYVPTDITMIASGSFTTCGGNFYDSGGPNGDYMDNQNAIMPSGGTVVTLYPAITGTKVSVTFNSFRTQTHYNDLNNFSQSNDDVLYVYNGNSTAATQIGALQGDAAYGTITSTAPDGSLTFKFVSRSPFYTPQSGSRSGWAATISCNYTPTDITMIASGSFTTCGGNFYDSGGPNGDYMDNQNSVMPSGGTVVTLYPAITGGKISVTFNSFRTQMHYSDFYNFSQKNDDVLYVYNGSSTIATQIGALQGDAAYGTITSTAPDGSLTFKFVSRSPFYTPQSGSRSGWAATISCDYTPSDITMIASGIYTVCNASFYDGGGPNGNYIDNQHSIIPSGGTVVTVYPDNSSERLNVSFHSFNTQTQYNDFSNFSLIRDDKLLIYNGPNTSSPNIAELSGNSLPGNYVSTSNDGSLTFKFVSFSPFYTPSSGVRAGWSANLFCSPALVSIDDISINSPLISVFPNPTFDKLNLYCSGLPIATYEVILTDLIGQTLLTKEYWITSGELEDLFDIKNYSSGIYFLRITSFNTMNKTVKIEKH